MSTRVKIELNAEAFGRLIEAGIAEYRPADLQAQVIVLRGLGMDPTPISAAPPPTPAPGGVLAPDPCPADDPLTSTDAA